MENYDLPELSNEDDFDFNSYSPADMQYVEDFICGLVRVFYRE